MTARARGALPLLFSILLAGCLLLSGTAYAGDWPQWHGPNRDGVSSESSGWDGATWLLTEAWRSGAGGVQNFGYGQGQPLLVKRSGDAVVKMYIHRWQGGLDRVYCVNAETGAKLWEESYTCPDYGRTANVNKSFYRGPLATPAMDLSNGYLYTLSCDGDVYCWDTTKSSSRAVWHFNLHSRFGGIPAAEREDYGFVGSPLLYGSWVIVEVGDDTGNLMAFDKATGATAWQSANTDDRGWASPTLLTVGSTPCVAAMTRRNMLVVRADSGHYGETVTSYSWKATYSGNIPSPIVSGNRVFFSRADGSGSRCAALDVTLSGHTTQWDTTGWWWGVSTAVLHGDHIYTAHVKKLRCRTLEGASVWASGDILENPHGQFDAASLIVCAGDDKLIVWDGLETGRLRLVRATSSPASYEQLATRNGVLDAVGMHSCGYSRIALGHGKLICNNIDGDFVCFSVGGASVPPAAPSGLSATPQSGTEVQVTWSDNSDDEDQFKVDRRESGTAPWVRVATTGANATSHTDSGLTLGTKYYYKVKAWNAACGNSDYSNVDDATTSTSGYVRISDASDGGVSCFKIETDNATYYYDKAGGGFTSLLDADGTDWISWQSGGGSAGEYRGIPNTGELHPGYTGGTSTTSNALDTWLSTVTINTTRNGYGARWEFFPTYAKMTLHTVAGGTTYWMLYEGTPGGAVDGSDRLYLSNGDDYSANDDHPWLGTYLDIANTSGAATGSEWVFFAASEKNRSLFLAHDDDGLEDDYWQMEDNMTVFGFGRRNYGVQSFMTMENAVLVIGFVDSKSYDTVKAAIDAAWDVAPAPPDPPGGCSAVAQSASEILVTWQDNSENEDQFKVDRRQSGTSPWVRVATPAANVTSCTDSGLPAATKFYYKVKAWRSAGGNSAYSNVDDATTHSAAVPEIAVSTTNILVSCTEGEDAADATFQVWNGGTGTLQYQLVEGSSKFDVAPATDSSTGSADKRTHTITFHTSGMAVGAHTRSFTVEDNGSGAANGPIRVGLQITVDAQTARNIDTRVAADADDAEERPGVPVYLDSSDLELTTDGTNVQTVGIRFDDVGLCFGATVTAAYVQFKVDEASSGACALTIRGEKSAGPVSFTTAIGDISSRPLTDASVSWSPPDWPTVGAANAAQRTPDLSALIQEIVDQPGWRPGNALVLIVTGTGRRTAESYKGDAAGAPLLHVAYSPGIPLDDGDADGMDDNWEIDCFGSTNAALAQPFEDKDGDGLCNIYEYIAGTNPTATSSVFETELSLSNGTVYVCFEALAAAGAGYDGLERRYALESAAGPGAGTWSPVAGHADILGADQTVRCPSAGTGSVYRGKVWLREQ